MRILVSAPTLELGKPRKGPSGPLHWRLFRMPMPNKFEAPGHQVQPSDVFSHWSVDYAGTFPVCTSDLHVIGLAHSVGKDKGGE